MCSPLGGALPVRTALACGTYGTSRAFASIPPLAGVPALDATAVLAGDGRSLHVFIVHRSAKAGPVKLALDVAGFGAALEAEAVTLSGEAPHERNTVDEPDRIAPRATSVQVGAGGAAALDLAPFSLTRVTFRRR
jgi:alpha-N-arabinofuranosidase